MQFLQYITSNRLLFWGSLFKLITNKLKILSVSLNHLSYVSTAAEALSFHVLQQHLTTSNVLESHVMMPSPFLLSLPHYTLIRGYTTVLCLCALGGQSCWGPVYLLTWKYVVDSSIQSFQLCVPLSFCCTAWSWRDQKNPSYLLAAVERVSLLNHFKMSTDNAVVTPSGRMLSFSPHQSYWDLIIFLYPLELTIHAICLTGFGLLCRSYSSNTVWLWESAR